MKPRTAPTRTTATAPRSVRRPARTASSAPAPAQGQTRVAPDADGNDLQLPHERDESTRVDDDQPRDVMRRAKADLDAGLVDTDMRATPGLDAQRRAELLRKQRR